MSEQRFVAIMQQALAHHQAGRLADAEQGYRQALAMAPDHPDALHLLGVIARQAGHAQASHDLIARAIALHPTAGEYHVHLGDALKDLRRLPEAESAYSAGLSRNPRLAEGHVKLADLLHETGRLDEAISSYRRALELQSNYPEALNNFGNALRKAGRFDEALAALQRAIALNPNLPQPHSNISIVLRKLGRLSEAEAACRRAIAIAPAAPDVYNNLGNILFDLRRNEEGLAAFERAVRLGPDSPFGHNNLGTALEHLGRLDEAEAAYRAAIALKPDLAGAWSNLGNALRQQARHDEALTALRRAVELEPTNQGAQSNLLYSIHLNPSFTGEQILAAHREWAASVSVGPAPPDIPATSRSPGQADGNGDVASFLSPSPARPDLRLQVGLISPDFYHHAVGRFLLALFQHHDRDRIQFIAFSDVPTGDAITQQLKSLADEWHDTAGLSHDQLASLIQTRRIDILIDLPLHSSNNRLLTFARRPAPRQITYLAYPSTSGLSAIDYRLTDAQLDPPDGPRPFYSEQSLYLNTYWCYAPLPDSPPIREREPGRPFTFGCLNAFSKINDGLLDAWAQILSSAPRSRLLLHAPEGATRQRVLARFASHGISPDRIEFSGKVPFYHYLDLYNRIDLALDPFPYAGGTTTCDALWMGCPVLTLAGRLAVHRSGASVLTAAGLPQFITHSPDDYIRRAVELASTRLPRIGRDELLHSRLMDAPAFTRDFESVLLRAP